MLVHPREVLAGSLILLALTGCASSASSGLAQSVAQSQSAVQTVRLALVQAHDGRLVDGVASTALSDMLREAQDAEAAASAVSPSSPSERALRNRVLTLLHGATRALVAGQDVVEQVPGAPSAATALRGLDDALRRLQAESRRLGSGR